MQNESKNNLLKTVEYKQVIIRALRGITMDFSILGNKIRQLRKDNNLTQEALADEIELSYTYLGQVERGVRGINLPNLVKLANKFNVSLDYLLSEYLNNNIGNESKSLDNEWLEIIKNKTPLEKKRYIAIIKDISKHI
jgi:transcriptional regulator with XRE-family HTH domain